MRRFVNQMLLMEEYPAPDFGQQRVDDLVRRTIHERV
jgi:hypothetical protein